MPRIRIFFVISMLSAATARGASINAASCSASDVQSAINAASIGDIVQIPGGTCAWTSGVTISKGITLNGRGSGRIIAYTADTLTVGTGTRTINIMLTGNFTITPGEALLVSQTGARSNYMAGTVISYVNGVLSMNITSTGGIGTTHRWLISTNPTTTIINNAGSSTLIDVTENVASHTNIGGVKISGGTGTGTAINVSFATNGLGVLIHDCWIESAANTSESIRTNANRGVIWNCSFDSSPFSVAPLGIHHKDEGNVTRTSWSSASTMGAADTTGSNNLYIEDSDFHAFLNATDDDDNARTVYRHNVFNNAGLGSHGADTSSFGMRHVEIYANRMVFNGYADGSTYNMNWWFFSRGGTWVITGNTIDKITSQDYGNKGDVNLTDMNLQRAAGPNPCWGAGTSNGAEYHTPRQVGTGFLTGTGKDGLGRSTDSVTYVGDAEPAYIWGNTVNNGPLKVVTSDYGGTDCSSPDVSANYIVAGRDYFDGTAKPGYISAVYPHPLRTGTLPAAPTNLRIVPNVP